MSTQNFECYFCNSIILNFSGEDAHKLDNATFFCGNCGHKNLFFNSKFYDVKKDSDLSIKYQY